MASNGANNIEDGIEDEDDNDRKRRRIVSNDEYPDTPDKQLVIDMSISETDVKKENMNNNPEGNQTMFFGSEGGGFLDILASVATSKLEEERFEGEIKKPDLQVDEENNQAELNIEKFKNDSHFMGIDHTTIVPGAKRLRENEGNCSTLSKRANPRRLADYERFGFAQISRMSLNTLLRLFSEPDFDEMRRMYSYKCYFMPDGVCQEKVQSFGNEAKAKAQMKNHLQSHIKETLKRDDYYQFTAEPVSARKKRIAQQSFAGTNNNISPEANITSAQLPQNKDLSGSLSIIKNEYLNENSSNLINIIRVPESAINLDVPKQENPCIIKVDRSMENANLDHKTNSHISHVDIRGDPMIRKVEPIIDTYLGKENVSTIANETNSNLIIKEIAVSSPDEINAKPHAINTASKDVPTEVPIKHCVVKEALETCSGTILDDSLACKEILRKSPIMSIIQTTQDENASVGEDTIANMKLERNLELEPNKEDQNLYAAEYSSRLQDIQASIMEDHCYSLIHKSKESQEFPPRNDAPSIDPHEHESNDSEIRQYETKPQCSRNDDIIIEQTELIQQGSTSAYQNINNFQISHDHSTPKSTREVELPTQLVSQYQPISVVSISDKSLQNSNMKYLLPIGSTTNLNDASFVEDGMKIISEKKIIPIFNNSNQNNAPSSTSFFMNSNSVPISPITSTNTVTTRARPRTRPASTSSFSPRVESKKVPDQTDKEKSEALQAIRELQAKGATTEDLSCHICQPSKCFTAYTTLLSHLRSHAGIRPYECQVCRAVFTRQHSLNYHLLIHQNETRFTCNDCGRKFRHPSHYKEHCRRHTGESPYQCTDCSARYKTRNTFKRHLKVHHGKILTASGTYTSMPKEAFAQLQEEERRKDQSKANNKVRNVIEALPVNNNIAVSEQQLNANINNQKKDEDDFVVDYHYGDSVSNDEEVARISAVTNDNDSPLKNISTEEESANMVNYDLKITDHNVLPIHGRQRQQSGSVRSTRSSGSYEPSNHSTFSTPSIDDHSSGNKASPIHYKITETPPLLNFDALPPTKITSTFVSRVPQQNLSTQRSFLQDTKPELQAGVLQRKRNLSDTSLNINNSIVENTSLFSKSSAFDPIAVGGNLPSGLNKTNTDLNRMKGVITSTQPHIIDSKKQIFTLTDNGSLKLPGTHPQVLSQAIVVRSSSNGDVGKPTFTLTPSTNNRTKIIVQSTPSKSSITTNTAVPKPQQLVVSDGHSITKQRIIVSKTTFKANQTTERTPEAQSNYTNAVVSNIKPAIGTMANGTTLTTPKITTSTQQPKQAVLAQINGRQVLLIPKQEEPVQNNEKTAFTSLITPQSGNEIARNPQASQYKIVKSMPLSQFPVIQRPINVTSRSAHYDDEQSKLERCLLYGSAAVEKANVSNAKTSVSQAETSKQCITILKNEPSDSYNPTKMGIFLDENNLSEKRVMNATNRESIESLRRDSSDSGKSDIITSSTIAHGFAAANQRSNLSNSNLSSAQNGQSYRILMPNTSKNDQSSSSQTVQRKAVVLTNDVVLDGTNIINIRNFPTNNHVSTFEDGRGNSNKNNDSIIHVATSKKAPVTRIYKEDSSPGSQIDLHRDLNGSYQNLSVSSDSGFADHSLNDTPQSLRFYKNSNNVYHVSS